MKNVIETEKNERRDQRAERASRAILACVTALSFVVVGYMAAETLLVGAGLLSSPGYWDWFTVALGSTMLGNGALMVALLASSFRSTRGMCSWIVVGLIAAGLCSVGFFIGVGLVVHGVLDPDSSPWQPLLWSFFSAILISASIAFSVFHPQRSAHAG